MPLDQSLAGERPVRPLLIGVRLELRYMENWSFALNLQVLWETFSVILGGSSAY